MRPDWRVWAPGLVSFVLVAALGFAALVKLGALRSPYPIRTESQGARTHARQPMWSQHGRLRPETLTLLAALKDARTEGLDPVRYDAAALAAMAAKLGHLDGAARSRFEADLSSALARYVADHRRPPPGEDVSYTDPALARPSIDPRTILSEAAAAPSLAAYLSQVRQGNPIYAALRAGLAAGRGSAHGGASDAEALLRLNMTRAQALPASLGERYVLVNVPARTLWLYERGRVALSMPVVVGKASEPTPSMAALIRFAVFNPYWNIPPDLVRQRVAPAVLRQGAHYLASQRFEVLSGWSDQAAQADPSTVDWRAVAQGLQTLRMRQAPGANNMMGRVKFMFPNGLGVYLHDTPIRSTFQTTERTASAGCVRLENAPALAQALLGDRATAPVSQAPEQRVDLPRPIPVYLTYLTLYPTTKGLRRYPDIYGRDAAALARR